MSAIAEASEPPSERPRLKIAPRTATTAPTSAKSSIFGGARTREEILASKGIDARKKDAELETKARPKRLTKQQAEELEAAKAEIMFEQERLATATTAGDKAAAQANVDAKEKEVAALGEKFKAQNLAYEHKKTAEKAGGAAGGAPKRPQFVRPSERRRMREEAQAEGGMPMDNKRDAAFLSFNQRSGGGGGGGYRPDDASYGSFNQGGGGRRGGSRGGYDQSGGDFSSFGGGSSRREAGEGCKLYVGNIDFDMNQADLQTLVSPFGRVQDTYLPVERDSGRPRGFAFVTYSSGAEAQAAIQALDGQNYNGRDLRVNVSEPRGN